MENNIQEQYRRQRARKLQEDKIQEALRKQLEVHPIEPRKLSLWRKVVVWWRTNLIGIPCVHQFEPLDFGDWNNDEVPCMHCSKTLRKIMMTEPVVFTPIYSKKYDRILYTAEQI